MKSTDDFLNLWFYGLFSCFMSLLLYCLRKSKFLFEIFWFRSKSISWVSAIFKLFYCIENCEFLFLYSFFEITDLLIYLEISGFLGDFKSFITWFEKSFINYVWFYISSFTSVFSAFLTKSTLCDLLTQRAIQAYLRRIGHLNC